MDQGEFFLKLEYQNSPLMALTDFLQAEERYEQSRQIEKMRFAGYVLDIGYDTATIITSDPYKIAVGGIPRGSFLILAPSVLTDLPPHFTLLRVMDTAPTPLSGQVQQTYFELHKKSMPELDIWTQSELQWGALKCAVLGMYYPNPARRDQIAFAGDVNTVVSAHRYRVYSPDEALLDIIVNGLVRPTAGDPVTIGHLRPTENQLAVLLNPGPETGAATSVKVSVDDFKGARTAMFGKTRLGKSNVVKLLAQAILDATAEDRSVGQLIFDINGEYANDNAQDGSRSIRSANESVCDVYALTKREGTPSKPLRLNFYEQPDSGIVILASLLEQDNRRSIYMGALESVQLPTVEQARDETDIGLRTRGVRRIQMFWAILHTAGFAANEAALASLRLRTPHGESAFDPHFLKGLRDLVHGKDSAPAAPRTLDEMTAEFRALARYAQDNPDNAEVKKALQADDLALLGFLQPRQASSAGPVVLNRYSKYHSPAATDFVTEILTALNAGRTVILDLGNANDQIREFFSDMLSRNVFAAQEQKFTTNSLGRHYVQLYFEEAHNLFPAGDKGLTGIYARFAKEGAKFHIGMTYSTQSPSTIYGELLTQTENFFVGHLSSSDETRALARLQRAFSGVEDEIMRSRTPGFMRMLTQSHRFVVPVQARLFEAGSGD